MLERIFKLTDRSTNPGKEILGGVVTFLTMAYIISVQPLMMSLYSNGWVSFGDETYMSIMVGTCLIAAIACLAMALLANLPVALAPGMGINIMFASMIGMTHISPQAALGVIFISGVLFFILSFFKLREFIMKLIKPSQQAAIVVGIGFFIMMIGLLNLSNPTGSYDLLSWRFTFTYDHNLFTAFAINLAILIALIMLKVPGALFIGMILGGIVASMFGLVNVTEFVAPIPSLAPTFFSIDILGALKVSLLPFIAMFLYVDMFETMATLIGVTRKADLVDESGNIPNASRALKADAIGTLGGSLLGISPVTSYIESSAGVVSGARTGLSTLVTAALFIVAMFFTPLWLNLATNAIIGPVLIVVGIYMVTEIKKIDWREWSDWIPALLTILVMVGMFSIANGLATGFICYPICKLLAGKGKELNWLHWTMTIISIVMLTLIITTF